METKNKLEIVGGLEGCAGGSCPTIYKDSNGKIFIQGYKISEELRKQATIASNEDIVELSPELIEQLKAF